MQVDLRDLRKIMDARFEKSDAKLDALDAKFDAKFDSLAIKIGELKVWALLVIGGGVLSMVGRALHWF
jgi:hypothetical protein